MGAAPGIAAAARWPGHKVAVNVSPIQFVRDDFVLMVRKALAASRGLLPQRLELEITESLFIDASPKALRNIDTLRQKLEMGIRVAMDDFGTGYSGLSHLRPFPSTRSRSTAPSFPSLGRAGIAWRLCRRSPLLHGASAFPRWRKASRQKKQLAWVRAAGCTEMQGYLFSRPVPAREIAGLLSPPRVGRQADQYLLTA